MHGIEVFGEGGEHGRGAVLLPQEHEARVPARVRAAGNVHGLAVGLRDHEVARGADERHLVRGVAGGRPFGAVAVGDLPHARERPVHYRVDLVLHAPGHAFDVAHAVPERRMRLLHGVHHDRHVAEREVLSFVGQHVRRKCLHHHRIALVVDALRLRRVHAVVAELVGRDAAAHADLEPAAAHVVEHADFFREAQRVVQGQRVDQRPEQDFFGALRDGRVEHRRRRAHAQRRRMVLGRVVAVDADPLVGLDQPQPVLVEVAQRQAARVEVVENTEFNGWIHPAMLLQSGASSISAICSRNSSMRSCQ